MSIACFLCALFAVAAVADDQHDALMDLHKSTGGESWKNADNWGKADDICTWYGVQCTHDPPGTSQVFSVTLANNNLKGTVPESIAKIEELKVLDLSRNDLSGTVPSDLGMLPKLQMLHLQNNGLTGELPATMFNLTVPYPPIQEVDLSYNKLSGPIPETLFGPEKLGPFAPVDGLKVFNLRYNAITGDIPTRVTRAAAMVSFLTGGNNMTGSIDSDLGLWLTSRKYCDLSGNTWACPLPSGVADKCQAVCK